MIKTLLLCGFVCLSLAQNATSAPQKSCRSTPRAACFNGKCPSGFSCLDDKCCEDKDIVFPGSGCQDFIEHCDKISCFHRDMYEFARANCAKTCNLCDNQPLAPQYNCNDILTDCGNRTSLCLDRDFQGYMALYCGRTCALCNYSEFSLADCSDSFDNCAQLGQDFCDNVKTSDYQRTVGCGKTCKAC